jgi:hypothetical protein
MQGRERLFGERDTIDFRQRYAAAIVVHGDRTVASDFHDDLGAAAGQMLVDRIRNQLPNQGP